jgi:putative transposase
VVSRGPCPRRGPVVGTADEIRTRRQQTLDAAYAANPDRFSRRTPTAPKLPTEAWINQPTPEALIQSA